jgi:hypothetical protein
MPEPWILGTREVWVAGLDESALGRGALLRPTSLRKLTCRCECLRILRLARRFPPVDIDDLARPATMSFVEMQDDAPAEALMASERTVWAGRPSRTFPSGSAE